MVRFPTGIFLFKIGAFCAREHLGVHGACTEGTQGVFYAIIVFVSLKKAKLTPIMVYKT